MYLSIIILPLISGIISGLLGRKIGIKGSHLISAIALIGAALLSCVIFYEIGIGGSPVKLKLMNWINSEILEINWSFYMDSLTVSMALLVTIVSACVHIYAIGYMEGDPAKYCGNLFSGLKLSNSGDTLKLMVPSDDRKIVRGWTNYPCMVTSYKMSENEMGYRGSNSKLNFVKEQRVDGSWNLKVKSKFLRYTLMDFERNYQIKNPSKQLNIKNFSTQNSSFFSSFNYWTVTGLIDAEGSFGLTIIKDSKRKLGYRTEATFQLGLHYQDINLLEQLKQFFGGVGYIYSYSNKNIANYVLKSQKDLAILINHLEKYPLLTQKGADFILFKKAIQLLNQKKHLTIEGLNQFVKIKSLMNLGLSDLLKSQFPEIKFVMPTLKREIISTILIPNPNWIAGFTSGDGNFGVRLSKNSKYSTGYRVQLIFSISQHERDLDLLECISNYLKVGKVYNYSKQPAVFYSVNDFSDIINIIIPLFEKNPIIGVKKQDFLNWCKIAKIIKERKHLTLEGINQIKKIKSRINTGKNI